SGEPLSLLVHLGDQGAGGIDSAQVTRSSLLMYRRGHTMCGKDHDSARGHLIGLVDEDHTAALQGLHHIPVVHDLLTYIHRRPVRLESLLDGGHRTVDPGTVATGTGQQYAFGHASTLEAALAAASPPADGAHPHKPE